MRTEEMLKLLSDWLDNRNDRALRARLSTACRDRSDAATRDQWLRLDLLIRAALAEGEPKANAAR